MNSSKGDLHRYDDFPIIGLVVSNPRASVSHDEISFSGLRQSCCVCFIDMINSTKITAELIDVEISKYYTIFLNAMATIATNFGARLVKNAGDSLIYYFPKIEGGNTNVSAFKDVLECAITMIVAHGVING